MTRIGILALLAPLALHAQLLQLLLVNGAQQTTLTPGSAYSLGQIPVNGTYDFVVRALNSGSAPITIAPNSPAISGSGFSITSPATPPPNIAPGAFLPIYIHFAGGGAGSYSANFQLDTLSVIFIITLDPVATLTASPPCTGPDSTNTIDFGNIAQGQTAACMLVLFNNSSQQITISTITIAGSGFQISQAVNTPLNLPAGVSGNFTVMFAPQTAASYSGSITINTQGLTQTFPLTGTAYNPALPTPSLQFDTNTPQSGQQITLTMTLPAPAPLTTLGSVNLTFQPDPSVAAFASGDPTVVFVANNARSIPFSIQQGSTKAVFAGQPGAVFQTGATTGKIAFTVSVTSGAQPAATPTASLTLAPIPLYVDNAIATALAGALNIQISGFDNTYSAGPMSFTFFDNTNNPIGSGPVSANFTSQFRTYFATSTDAGAFQMLVTFPITGNAADVGSVNVQLTNSAGTSTITQLVFINDTGSCVLVGQVLSCPGAPTQ